jgi:UPF0755 protein
MNYLFKILVPLGFLILVLSVCLRWFGPTGKTDQLEIFIIPQGLKGFKTTKALQEQKFIKNANFFQILLAIFNFNKEVQPGGYRLAKRMNAWQVFKKITGKPDLFWVTITNCQRKEQIGETLTKALSWSPKELDKWNTVYANSKPEYFEGVYYPDTYLIPADEPGNLVAQRFINRFNEKFTPLADKFMAKNIKWTTGLKIASLIGREAAGPEDRKIISGIIWNRLNQNMLLQIDATMQYTLGKNDSGEWWGTINIAEKKNPSPYNTYLHKGLPPTPICNPTIEEIEAALNPEETDCLFYLHDRNKVLHCAKTYEEHKANIQKYLDCPG